ncbi:HNH endonuclease-domain-containing protein [Kalaharituber pfeilii]|nr:HNH endonuclease-domain-containing protein [Kalaharituber pfeilii]
MSANRSAGRHVHIYDANDTETANFYSMVEIFLFFNEPYYLRKEDGTEVQRDEQALTCGNYYVVTSGKFEPWLVRTVSVCSGTRVAEFRDAVRERDQRCVITGQRYVSARGSWAGFQAAHIFPPAYEGHWIEKDYGRWITIPPGTGGSINSVQNGLLLRADIHILFDSYDVSINPDDNNKIVCFDNDSHGIAGEYVEFGGDERGPAIELLRWHFRQAVLANMRGAGEPVFETDFPPGSDVMGQIIQGPMAAERMEFELFSRMAGLSSP